MQPPSACPKLEPFGGIGHEADLHELPEASAWKGQKEEVRREEARASFLLGLEKWSRVKISLGWGANQLTSPSPLQTAWL